MENSVDVKMRQGGEERGGENNIPQATCPSQVSGESFLPPAFRRFWRGAPDLERPSGEANPRLKGLEILRVRVRARARVTEVRVRVRVTEVRVS